MNRVNIQSEHRAQAFVLAAGVHLLFAAVLVFGVAWHAKAPQSYEAELWTDLPQPAAAPTPVPPPPRPEEPIKAVPPKPILAPTPPKALAVPAADIALKQKKVRELQAQQLNLEKLAAQKELKNAQAKRVEALRVQQLQEQQAAAQAQSVRAEKAAAEPAAKKSEVQRYTNAIIDKIKSNIRVTDNISKGTVVQVKITVLPDGSVLEPIRIMIPSGNKVWDEAALQGIMRSQPLPLPTDPALRRDMRDLVLLINYEK